MIPNKTSELIVYIAAKLKDASQHYGITILGKSLYFIDCVSYVKRGKPISGLGYVKQDFGPTPESAKFLKIKDDLLVKGDLQLSKKEFFGRIQHKFIATREADINLFDKDELVLIDSVLNRIAIYSASEISDITHQMISWQFATPKEELPFYTYLLTSVEPEQAHLDWAQSLINSYKD